MLYNDFRSAQGGEDKVVHNMVSLFERHRIDVRLLTRSSKGLNLLGKGRAFFSGIFSFDSYRVVKKLVLHEQPDVVHVHNLYPFFSPSVLVACRRVGTPVVMTLHNFGLTCPHWFHLRDGQICELCTEGNFLWCVRHNCQKNLMESAGYALRSTFARSLGLFRKNVTCFIALTEFAKNRIIEAGYDAETIHVFPNMIEIPPRGTDVGSGKFVAFAGRMSSEKGLETLAAAAQRLPDVPIKLAGAGPLLGSLKTTAPSTMQFEGLLNAAQLDRFLREARFLVVPSVWYEMCPTVILEAMALGLPVIASKIGGLPELVKDGVNGLLFEPGDSDSLAEKIQTLWEDSMLCKALGRAARTWAKEECSETVYFERLMMVYRDAMSRIVEDPH